MTLTQLRYLVAIADCDLNVTAAAARVYATQSGVSKQIKQLESELGYPLFIRIGKCLDRVTTAGDAVIRHARTILARVADIRCLELECNGDDNDAGPPLRCPRARAAKATADELVSQ